MIDRFPYGKAPFWLMALALVSTALLVLVSRSPEKAAPDLVFAFYAQNHHPLYQRVVPAFERKHGVKVRLQVVNARVLNTRLQNAMLAGTEVPDLVEIQDGSLGAFTRGPLADVGFVDLTERLEREGYRSRLVESRLSLWSSRGHVFALPHDVHPVMLMYRADLVQALGIDVERLNTWDEFAAVGRRVVKDLDGDGVPDRYMIDLPSGGAWGLMVLLRQRGVGLFDEQGQVDFDRELTVDTIIWYLHQSYGSDRIAYDCGSGQPLLKAMRDGLALFYVAPDWRTFIVEQEAPKLAGKMKLVPLPAWEPGGRRTSVWGGSGLSITKASKHRELAWEFAKSLYFDPQQLGQRFLSTNLIPPFKEAWNLPELKRPNPYFSGQPLGSLYAALAPETPPTWTNAYSSQADARLSEVFLRAAVHYKANGDSGLRELLRRELHSAKEYLDRIMARNVLARR